MNLALLFGGNGDRIRAKYKSMHDDVYCDCYQSIPDFISACEARGITYDRVIMVSSAVKVDASKAFEMLEDFVRTTPATVYVMIAKKGMDDDFAQVFVNTVNSSSAVAMLVTSTTQITLEEALSLSADEINTRYGCISQQKVEIEREDYEIPEEVKPPAEEQSKSEEPVKPEKKKGFFARLKEANQIIKQQKAEQAAKAKEMADSQISENQEIQPDSAMTDDYAEGYAEQPLVDNGEYSEESYSEEVDYTEENASEYSEDDFSEEVEESSDSEYDTENFENIAPELSSDEGFEEGDDSNFFTSQNIGSEVGDEFFEDSDATSPEEDDSAFFAQTGSDFSSDNDDFGFSEDDFSMDNSESEEDDSSFFSQGMPEQTQDTTDDFSDLTPIEDEDLSSINGVSVEDTIAEEEEQKSDEIRKSERLERFYKSKDFKPLSQEEGTDKKSTGTSDDDFSNLVNEVENIEVPAPEPVPEPTPVRTSRSASGNRRPMPRPARHATGKTEAENKRNVPAVRPTGEVVEVSDDLFSDIDDIIGLDEEYRQEEKEKNVRVVEKVVEREVIKEVKVSGSSKSVLTSIFKGKTKKIVLVTGARGSGATTLAYDIANYFAKHCPVLYVDGDTELHGFLNYVDYSRVTDYENTKLQGIRLCRSASAFANCVIRFDRNFDLLTSDFFIETSDDEYETMQGVITDVSRDYGVVVCDIPMSKLHLCEELIASGNIVLTAEMSQRGYMNLCCEFQSSPLRDKYKRTIVSRGTLALTKCDGKKFSEKDLKKYVSQIVEFEEDDADWTSMKSIKREKNISDKFLEEILEG